ncbi:glycoside hydrolase family 36 protein [Arcanobacterium phocae]|uniref:glycoside hydrolase family 36 protein n=1 Tax=Arcanobacterium phocae TaxID=131112 RepID=UPI001C0F0339|nr:glycoside hydrolase family 36 protein [Arcanobacterium phocae]
MATTVDYRSFGIDIDNAQKVAGGYIISARKLSLPHPWGNTEYYRHGWNSWTPTRWWSLDRKPWRIWNKPDRSLTAEDITTDSTTLHRSAMVTALNGPDGQTFLIGAINTSAPLLTISTERITATCEGEHAQWFVALGNERDVFNSYIAQIVSLENMRQPLHVMDTCGPMWSSWYSWFEEITEEIIISEISPAKELGYGAIQIDDGWQQSVGHWNPNTKFSHGIADIAAQIHDAGMKTGLWIAPFIAVSSAPVIERFPELFLHNDDGNLKPAGYNWGQYYYTLDFANPLAHEWLADTMSRLVHWGIDMFKLDFLYAAAISGQRTGDMLREDAYRKGLETIRNTVGDDVYLLGSGAVINASFGVLDGIRVSPDTAPYWDNVERVNDPSGPSVLNALRNSLSRTWLKAAIDCDPDVAYFRTRGSLLSPEINTLTGQASLICEFPQSSCPSTWLTDREKEAVRQWINRARQRPKIQQISRYEYTIDQDLVRFGDYLHPTGRISDRLLVK